MTSTYDTMIQDTPFGLVFLGSPSDLQAPVPDTPVIDQPGYDLNEELVQASLAMAVAITFEATLSFLGLGTQPPTPSWGSMLNIAQAYLGRAPWLALWPGLAIFVTVLSLNLVGDGLREVLDPRLR